jgi:hypothetical protein
MSGIFYIMAFDLLTMVITSVAVFILTVPVLISFINLIVELWVSYKDGTLTPEEAERIKMKRNKLSRVFLRALSVFGINLPWAEDIKKVSE